MGKLVDNKTTDQSDVTNIASKLMQYRDELTTKDITMANRAHQLRHALSTIRNAHPGALPDALRWILSIEEKLAWGGVSFKKVPAIDHRRNRNYLLDIVTEALNSAHSSLFPPNSVCNWQSLRGSNDQPAVQLADYHSCLQVAAVFRRIYADLDRMLEEELDVDNCDEFFSIAEGMKATADALEQIYKAWPKSSSKPRWCGCCFRRAPTNSRYCNLHRAGQKFPGQDTSYRRSRKIRQALSDDIQVRLLRHQALQLITKEVGDSSFTSFEYYFQTENLPKVVIPDELTNFLRCFFNANAWPAIQLELHEIVSRSYPLLAQQILGVLSQAPSWSKFCQTFHHALENKIETTENPLNILLIMADAEAWLLAEERVRDKRNTDTKEKIIDLYNRGIKASEIAKQLDVARQYVYLKIKQKTEPHPDLI